MRRSVVGIAFGIGCIVAGGLVVANMAHFFVRSDVVGQHLLKQATVSVTPANQTVPAQAQVKSQKTIATSKPKLNGLVGDISIPAISLKAPIVQGTDDPELNVAVGHLTTSVMPGQTGTSVLAAHNATWFRHIDQLKSGDLFTVATTEGTYTFKVTRSEIVHTGDPVYNTADASVVLESCYPLDALYLTPKRYLVFAEMVAGSSGGSVGADGMQYTDSVEYQTDIPEAIRKLGVTLATNSLPMGQLTYTGAPSDDFIQSNSPLNAASGLVQLFLAWVHASSAKDTSALQTIWPGRTGVSQNPLFGVPMAEISYGSSFDVNLDVQGTTLQSVRGLVDVRTPSGVVHVSVQAQAVGDHLSLQSLTVRR